MEKLLEEILRVASDKRFEKEVRLANIQSLVKTALGGLARGRKTGDEVQEQNSSPIKKHSDKRLGKNPTSGPSGDI